MRWAWVVVVGALAASAGAARAQDGRPDARLEFTSTAYGFLVGVNKGQGNLIFKERQYLFSVSSVKFGTLGFTRVDAEGQVYRLRELADFPGRYYAAEGAFTLGQGGGGAVLRNEKGVTLYLQNLHKGVELTLGGASFDIGFTQSAASSPPVPAASTGTR